MICQTVKPGVECVFMKKAGCGYNGGKCHSVVDECTGCDRIEELPSGQYCSVYPDPRLKWKNGTCNFATHVKKQSDTPKATLNALKASKRKAAGRM
ncbi:MAG: PxxKW family cysteine-rich protein [Deltaproteobacteria bacterium]|nr:PxxKW family cysteine-rich protein [Deltaproteobacteria bacterium]